MSQQCFKQIYIFLFSMEAISCCYNFRKCVKYDSFANTQVLVVVHFEGHTIVKASYGRSW